MASELSGAPGQGLGGQFPSWVENIRKLLSLTEALSAAYVLVIGLFGNRIPKEQFLMGGVFWYATLTGLLFIGQRVIRPKSDLFIPPGARVRRGLKAGLARIHWVWFMATILYLGASGAGFWFWIDREFLNKPPIIRALRPQAAQLAPCHQTKIKVWAEDPERGNLIYKWVASYGEVQPNVTDNTIAIYRAPGTVGQQHVTVIVIDDKGKRTERSVIIDVRP